MKGLAIGALAGVIALAGAGPVQGQSSTAEPPRAGIQLGPVGLAPALRLTEFGYDSNVYNRSNDNNPDGDFVSTASTSLEATLRSSHIRATGHAQYDFYYFRTLPDLRSIDSDNNVQISWLLNRLTLTFATGRIDTRHRQNLEIDAIARRETDGTTVGAAVRLTGKTSLVASIQRSHLLYEENSFYLGTDLAEVLNHTSSGVTVGVRHAITPLTTFAIEVARETADFDSAVDRNSEEFRIVPSVEFSPFALISGRASIGFYRRKFPPAIVPATTGTTGTPTDPTGASNATGTTGSTATTATTPEAAGTESTGTNMFVNLNYTLLGRTRFTVGASRRLEYSYLAGLQDYTEAGLTGSVTQRFGESWDAVGRLGRAHLTYSPPIDPLAAPVPNETVLSLGMEVGYNLRRTRINLYLERNRRDSDGQDANRGYQRVRFGSSATYFF